MNLNKSNKRGKERRGVCSQMKKLTEMSVAQVKESVCQIINKWQSQR